MTAKPSSARLAPALETLRAQIDALWPERPRHADGWIGDEAHRARKSDHNPTTNGLVHALDITDGVLPGLTIGWGWMLVEFLRASRDPRLAYVIHRATIWAGERGPRPWEPRIYRGRNGHWGHVHVSVSTDPKLANDPSLWKL